MMHERYLRNKSIGQRIGTIDNMDVEGNILAEGGKFDPRTRKPVRFGLAAFVNLTTVIELANGCLWKRVEANFKRAMR